MGIKSDEGGICTIGLCVGVGIVLTINAVREFVLCKLVSCVQY